MALSSSIPRPGAAGTAPRPSAPRRPGETYARAEVPLAALQEIALAAAEASLPVDVAGTLVAEAALLLERLDRRRIRGGAALLDRAAGRSRPTQALSPGGADYLRALSCRTWRRNQPELDLPLRVLERLEDRAGELIARTELLESAIRWEIAAVLRGRTMSCWGSETLLAGFSRTG